MIKKIVFAGAGLLLLASPLVTSAQTTDTQAKIAELTAQIQQLMQIISQLKATINAQSTQRAPVAVPPGAGTANCPLPLPSRYLSLGSTGLEVAALQGFLIAHGLLANGKTTGYYGPMTVNAVQRYQSSIGLISSGNASTTGYGVVDSRTRAAILQTCSKGVSVPTPIPSPIFTPVSTSTPTSTPTVATTSVPTPVPTPIIIPVPTTPQATILSFAASQSPIESGQPVTLYWSVTNVGGCVLSQQVPGQQMYIINSFLPFSGSIVTSPKQTTAYTLACTSIGALGAGLVRTVSVYVY
jgi:peptidoglycan hydrolase-like protein with peptidoglycan-binding domain